MDKNRILRIVIIDFIVVLILAAGAFWYFTNSAGQDNTAAETTAASSPMAGADIGGPYTMVNQDGETVTEQTYINDYKLIYFGFTYCPHICPTELQKMTAAMKILGDTAEKITPVFVTTDPERDTPEVVKDYVALFHPRMVGLTGSLEQVKAIQDEYKVYAAKTEDPELSEYTMNHSSYTYLMGPGDVLLALFSGDDTPADMAAEIKPLVK